MQYALFLAGVVALVLTLVYLPETSHPGTRGIDKLYEHGDLERGRFKWVWLNPFRSVLLLKSPNMILIVRWHKLPACSRPIVLTLSTDAGFDIRTYD